MKSFIRFIKRIFGVYETGCEYWVYLKMKSEIPLALADGTNDRE